MWDVLRAMGLFVLAGVAEIGGGWLMWRVAAGREAGLVWGGRHGARPSSFCYGVIPHCQTALRSGFTRYTADSSSCWPSSGAGCSTATSPRSQRRDRCGDGISRRLLLIMYWPLAFRWNRRPIRFRRVAFLRMPTLGRPASLPPLPRRRTDANAKSEPDSARRGTRTPASLHPSSRTPSAT